MENAYEVMGKIFHSEFSLLKIFLGISRLKLFLLFTALAVVFILERLNEINPGYFQNLFAKKLIKYSAYYYAVILILLLGVYDNTPNFIYFQF